MFARACSRVVRRSALDGVVLVSIGNIEAAAVERWHHDCEDARADDMANLVATIRGKIDAGVLPCEPPEKMVGAPSDGRPCTACDTPITPTEIALTFWHKTLETHRFHLVCHKLWESECRRRGWRIRA